MKFTDEQKSFIEDRGHNILVSAAAGSGKTAVITERVIRLITEDGYSVSELLIVTFTRAAASEMRDRIRDAIAKRLMEGDLTNAQKEHLSKQLTLIYTADITTIDSFCLNLVREHFNICRIDPSFRVADEGELKLIAEEVMDSLLEERYASEDEAFLDFTDYASLGRDDSGVADAIRNVYRFAVARPDPAAFISSMMKEYEVSTEEELDETGFMRELLKLAKGKISIAINILRHALEVCEAPGGPYIYKDTICSDIELAEGLMSLKTYGSLKEALNGLSFSNLSGRKDDAIDPELREKAKKLRERAKKKIREELAGNLFEKSTDDILYELGNCLPFVSMLSELTLAYMERYRAARQERGVVDFSDLEHMALEILKDEDTRDLIRGRYRELIIDEYQDCNRVQEAIFTSIANGHNYVTVGDVKQSIYSFRDACPGLFMDKYERYLTGSDEASRLITLSMNFRSSIPVTRAVNGVFSSIMSRECGGALYDESQSLNYGDVYKNAPPEWETEYITAQYSGDSEDAVRAEAHAIAQRIKKLTGVTPLPVESRKDNSVHDCSFGDIVILLRSVKGVSDIFSEVFAEEQIPLVFDSKGGYLLSFEIKEMMNLLSVIDNPRQDIPLAGVMMGYFGMFTASEMVYVRAQDKGGDLYDSVRAEAANKTPDTDAPEGLPEKCLAFLDMLEGYRKMSVFTPIHELVDRIISDHHYDHYVRALPDGVRREGNLRLLAKRAADYEETSFHGLFKFLRYIDNMKKYEVEFGEASGEGASDAVRIMSIHHSKGLEFPVVFVSTLGRNMNKNDARGTMLFDDELGCGCDLIIKKKNLKIKTLIKKVISIKMGASTVSEEMRILYVAMTRAENKLILTSKLDPKTFLKSDPLEADSLSDFIDVSEALHAIPYSPEESGTAAASGGAESPIRQALRLKEAVSPEEVRKILDDTGYVYPYERSLNVPQKVSVSFIKHEAMEEKGVSIASDPRGDRVIPTAGALRGSAVHTAYENLPLDLEPEEKAVSDFLDSLVRSRKLTAEERGYIKTSDIIDFLKSDICRRMHEASEQKTLRREQPFIISVEASLIDPAYPAEDHVMVQGIIDAFFLEGDKVVVVDYKTDAVSDEQVLVDRYSAQLDYYEKALRQLLSVTDSEKVIYSVSMSREINL